MNNKKVDTYIKCGEKGVGKTTYVKQMWERHIFIDCGNPLNQCKTLGALFFALNCIYDKITDDQPTIINHLHKAIQDGYVLILDEAEHITPELLKIIINSAIMLGDSTIVFTFDFDNEHLYESKIFRLLIEWDIVSVNNLIENFSASTHSFVNFIDDCQYGLSGTLKKELIEISNHNFINLKNLIWLIKNKQSDLDKISEDVITEYSYYLVEDKLRNLPTDLLDILKKSSLIGEMFQRCILESSDGFHFLGVKDYLKKLEATNQFIQSYLDNDVYKFVTSEIYSGIKNSIEPHEKLESQKILLHYYMSKLKIGQEKDNIFEYLIPLKRLSYEINDQEIMFFADKKLLFHYITVGDISKARETLKDLLVYCKENTDDRMLYVFLSYYKINLDLNVRDFNTALIQIHKMQREFYNSNFYLQYYYTRSLYGIGDIDTAYREISKLKDALKATSSKATENQPIYALTYSLYATIQHHFGIEDLGNKYYSLALKHAEAKLKDKSIYYEILKKCDMYFDFKISYPLLLESISYFESVGKLYDAAEIYVNIATEMIFNDVENINQAKRYFENARKIFSNTPNENLAYVQNNWALLHIIQYGDFQAALGLLEKSLLVGMSDFTYMTIYLNICMCYLNVYSYDKAEFIQAYEMFNKYHMAIASRENSTQYENLYKKLLDILIMERQGKCQDIVVQIDDILSNSLDQFFYPVLIDIKTRNSQSINCIRKYNDNNVLYQTFNMYKIFMAEFRFWE